MFNSAETVISGQWSVVSDQSPGVWNRASSGVFN